MKMMNILANFPYLCPIMKPFRAKIRTKKVVGQSCCQRPKTLSNYYRPIRFYREGNHRIFLVSENRTQRQSYITTGF